MYCKKLNISLVSLLACFAGQAIFGTSAAASSPISAKHNNSTSTWHKHNVIKISITTSQKTFPTKQTNKVQTLPDSKKSRTPEITTTKQKNLPLSKPKPIPQTIATDTTSSIQNRKGILAQTQEFKLTPRFNLWGFTGNSTLTAGQFMLPLYGDQSRAFYSLVEGSITNRDSVWSGGAGLGYRQVISDHIYGGYTTMDYSSTPWHNGFWIVHPGAEILGNVWDFTINGYIPTKQKKIINEDWADKLGIYDYVRFAGHSEYNHKIQLTEESSEGVSLGVSRVLPKLTNAKLYLGGYHFATQTAGITNGIETKLTYKLNKATALNLIESNDNINHNKLLVGIKITLGDYNDKEKEAFGIASRLLDPIEPTVALFSSSNIASSKRKNVDQGEQANEEQNNLWFFKPAQANSDTTGDGTYEHPFIGFTPSNENIVVSNATSGYPLLYFAPGTYGLNAFQSERVDGRFLLPNGWGMYGRTADYVLPAMGNDRPRFDGGLDLDYSTAHERQAATTLNSIQIFNTTGSTNADDFSNAALRVVNASDVVLQNVDIRNKVAGNDSNKYAYGMYVANSNVDFAKLNATVDGTNTSEGDASVPSSSGYYGNGYGIYVNDSHASTINFTGGVNNILGYGSGNRYASKGSGIYVAGAPNSRNSTINFIGGNNNITGSEDRVSLGDDYGIYALNSTINFIGGNNNITGGDTGNGSGDDYGIYAANSNILFNNGINSVTGAGQGTGRGISANNATISFINGENTVVGNGSGTNQGAGYGIDATGSAINFIGGKNVVVGIGTTTNSGDAHGYGINANNTIIQFNQGNNTIVGTGANVSDQTGSGYGYGIHAFNNSTINFINGDNNIVGSGIIAGTTVYSGYGFGISLGSPNSSDNSKMVFYSDAAKKVTITADGSFSKYGIYANSGSKIQETNNGGITTTDIEDGKRIKEKYAEFDTNTTSSLLPGKAVIWYGIPSSYQNYPLDW